MLIQRSFFTATVLSCLVCIQSTAKSQDAKKTNLSVAVLQKLADDEIAKALDVLNPVASTDALSLGKKDDQGLSVAAGAIHRKLAQLSTDEQYDLLHAWSMPTGDSSSVRLIASFVPQSAPPKAFAREIGERPRDSTFAISSINSVRGLFCSGWTLVQAADDIGRLGRLTTELEGLVETKTPGAQLLLAMAQIASRRGDSAAIQSTFTKRLERLSAQPLEDSTDFVLAVAALGNDELRPIAIQILEQLNQTIDKRPHHERAFLRIAHAIAVQTNYGESAPDVLYQNAHKYWVPADTTTSRSNQRGIPKSMWLVHESHVLHLGGPLNSALLCRFPMTGEFAFGCDVQDAAEPETHGGIVYGGLQFEPHGKIQKLFVCDTGRTHLVEKFCPFARLYDPINFNRLTFESTSENKVFAMNRKPVWRDPALQQNSPWLGLRSDGRRRPVFRNIAVAGKPEIPSKIQLLEANDLRGWSADFFGETLPPFHTDAKPTSNGNENSTASSHDWKVDNGELQASVRVIPDGATKQSLLRYQRPLLDGESINYEFFYEADKAQVHPALGRIAFLIAESGIRVRWITDGPNEWTGLPTDNAILEPLSRRGPRKPVLKAGWNQLSIAIQDGKANLTLNGELSYQRAIDVGQINTFGLYRDSTQTAARVRNLSMSGNWPKELPADFNRDPTVTIQQIAQE